MLKVPIYIYETGSTIYSDLDTGVEQGYAPMYQNDLKVFKGVANTLKFTVKNQDQKPIDISSGNTFKFTILDKENGASFLNKTMTVVDDGSTRSTRGVVTVDLNESDTIDLVSQMYRFSITRTVDNKIKPMYVNTYHDACGRIEILDACYAMHEASDEVTTFSETTDPDTQVSSYYSSHINANARLKRANDLHTIQYYTSGYDGTIELEATLDNQPSNGTDWVSIKTVTLSNATVNDYFNVNGVYNWLRIKHIPSNSNTGTLDKVLVRS
jgi:hypothetical protein